MANASHLAHASKYTAVLWRTFLTHQLEFCQDEARHCQVCEGSESSQGEQGV
jgi:hypothetical protein